MATASSRQFPTGVYRRPQRNATYSSFAATALIATGSAAQVRSNVATRLVPQAITGVITVVTGGSGGTHNAVAALTGQVTVITAPKLAALSDTVPPPQVTVDVTGGAGGTIVGGFFRDGVWHTLIPAKYWPRREYNKLKSDVAREKRELARRDRGLTELQKAERDLKQHEAYCEDCAAALKNNLTKEHYKAFVEADAKLTELRSRVAELRAADAAAKDKSAKAKAKAEELALRKAKEELAAQERRRQEIIDSFAENARVLRAVSELQTHGALAALAQRRLEQLRAEQERDEEEALFLLMNH